MPHQKYSAFSEIFGRFWALYALLLFVATMLVALPFYLICFIMKEPRASRWHRSVSRVWMTVFLNLIGCPLRVVGLENFVPGENYVIVCNHNSLMDVPVTTPFMANPNKTIAKKEFAYTPVFGWIYSAGAILVDRKNSNSRKQSYNRMKAVLQLGLDMVIYPEGTRNKSDKPLGEFHDGAFRLAKDCGKRIVPTLLFNTKKVLPASKIFFMLPHKISMHFLPPVSSDDVSITELKETVFAKMESYYVAHNG